MPHSDWKFVCGSLILVVCAGTVVCALSGSGRPPLGSHAGGSPGRTVARQAASPRSGAVDRPTREWPAAGDVDREVLAAADDAKDLQATFEAGAAELLPTMVAMYSPKLLEGERERCAEAFGEQTGWQCEYTITTVMRRAGEEDAAVVFTRATLHDEAAAACEQFVGCVTRLRAGMKIPVAGQIRGLTAFSQHAISRPTLPRLNDPVELKKLIEVLEADTRLAREQGIPADDHKLNYAVLKQVEIIDYMKQALEELER